MKWTRARSSPNPMHVSRTHFVPCMVRNAAFDCSEYKLQNRYYVVLKVQSIKVMDFCSKIEEIRIRDLIYLKFI